MLYPFLFIHHLACFIMSLKIYFKGGVPKVKCQYKDLKKKVPY